MEFEGNESWGYNTVYHLALDKRYGPPTKLKELIDFMSSKRNSCDFRCCTKSRIWSFTIS